MSDIQKLISLSLAMVAHGVGIAIFPKHCVDGSEYKSKLKTHSVDSKICKNTIYIATIRTIFQPMRVQKVIDTFLGMK